MVENALYHGIKNKRGKGYISVRGWMEPEWLCFSVEDNGIGMKDQQLAALREQMRSLTSPSEDQSYGLYNVGKRLELYYNRTGLLDIHSVYTEGTKVTLRIPAADYV